MARVRPHRHLLSLAEHVSAPTRPRPLLNDLIAAQLANQSGPCPHARAARPSCAGSGPARAAPVLCQADRSRRTRRIPRVLRQLPLQPLHPRGQVPLSLISLSFGRDRSAMGSVSPDLASARVLRRRSLRRGPVRDHAPPSGGTHGGGCAPIARHLRHDASIWHGQLKLSGNA